jgi:hypothetical protein
VDSAIWTPKLVVPVGPIIPCPAIEEFFSWLEKKERKAIGDTLLRARNGILMMAGSLCNYSSKSLQDLLWGKTAYAGETNIYAALYASAIDDTLAGNSAGECAYTSYARLLLTNNTTIFAAGSGTTTYTKTFPSDAAKSWATSTGTGTNNTITYLGFLNGNAGTSADKGLAWCTVTSTTINSGDTPQLAVNAVSVVQD